MTSRMSAPYTVKWVSFDVQTVVFMHFDERKQLPVPAVFTTATSSYRGLGGTSGQNMETWCSGSHDATRHHTRFFTIAVPLWQEQESHCISLRHWLLSWASTIQALFLSNSSFGNTMPMWQGTVQYMCCLSVSFLLMYLFFLLFPGVDGQLNLPIECSNWTAEPSYWLVELDSWTFLLIGRTGQLNLPIDWSKWTAEPSSWVVQLDS
jgi:hypothetical protein